MYFSKSAAVLVTLAVGQAAAGSLRHAHLHRARHAEPEPINTEENIEERDVDWSTIDWSKVSYTWSQNQQWTSAPAAAASSVVASVAAAAAPTTTLVTSAAPATSAAASSTVAASSSKTSSSASASSTSGGVIGSIVSSLLDTDSSKLKSMSFAAMGINSKTSGSSIWIGSDGSYTNTFTNKANEDIILVCWGPDGSWVNVKQPLFTLSLPQCASTTISFANGVSGSCAGIYEGTQMVNGQISDTWMEFTMSPQGVVDVSREVNMDGHSIEVVGPHCTTNMNKCVFVCSGGATTCMTGYQLLNCDAGSQAGAQSGSDPALGGAASGGCGWLGQDNAKLQTSFT